MSGHRDLALASAVAVLCALVAALVPVEVVRVIAAVPLTLYLPGFALVAAVFDGEELTPLKRLTIEVAASLIVLVLSAFVLNIFPFGLRTASWAVLLPLLVVVGCAVAARRRGKAGQQRPPFASFGRPSTGATVLVVAAALIGAAAIALAQKPLPAKHADGYTALWMLPANAREKAVVVGVQSNEQHPASYELLVGIGRESQSETYRVRLDPGHEKTFEVKVPRRSTDRTRVVASLYRKGRTDRLFRRVVRWLPRQSNFP